MHKPASTYCTSSSFKVGYCPTQAEKVSLTDSVC